ncbi:MAG: hypothetical protein PVF07_07620 [Thiogranum sp.]
MGNEEVLLGLWGGVDSPIEDLTKIKKILDHLKTKTEVTEFTSLPESRAPPLGLPVGISD